MVNWFVQSALVQTNTTPENRVSPAALDPWHKLELRNFQKDIAARSKYAEKVFVLVRNWLASLLTVLLLHGFLSKRDAVLNWTGSGSKWQTSIHFELSDPVIVALIGGTTASLIGLLAIVASYLFPKKPEKPNEETAKQNGRELQTRRLER